MTKNPNVANSLMMVLVLIVISCNLGPSLHVGQGYDQSEQQHPSEFSPMVKEDSLVSNYVISENITLPAGQNMIFSNNEVLVSSPSLREIVIQVNGSLTLRNSWLTIGNSSANSVASVLILANPGSNVSIIDSNVSISGWIIGNGTVFRVENSKISSDTACDSCRQNITPFLGESFNDSEVEIVNSTLTGLCNQTDPFNYSALSQYMNTPFFARNGTLPLTVPETISGSNPFINWIDLNVTFFGNTVGSSAMLELILNDSFQSNMTLVYHGGTDTIIRERVNISNYSKFAEWFEESGNFQMDLVENGSEPVEITNVTVVFQSNDSLAIYGAAAFNIMIRSSELWVNNSAIGINYIPKAFKNGEPDYRSHHVVATDSLIVFNGSSALTFSYLGSSLFDLVNSTALVYGSVTVQPVDGVLPVRNFNYSIVPENNPDTNYVKWHNSRYRRIIQERNGSVLLYAIQQNSTISYMGDYGMIWNGHYELFSVGYMPVLTRAFTELRIDLNVTEITLNISSAFENGSGTFLYIQYELSGNTSSFTGGSISVLLSINGSQYGYLSAYNITGSEKNGNMNLSFPGITYRNETILLAFKTSGSYAVTNLSHLQSAVLTRSNQPSHTGYKVLINLIGGNSQYMWKALVGNRSIKFYNTSARLILQNRSTNFSIIPPQGYEIMREEIAQSNSSEETLNVFITPLTYSVDFILSEPVHGGTWEAVISGRVVNSTSIHIVVNLTPGHYNYYIVLPGGYRSSDAYGIINLTSNETVTVKVRSDQTVLWLISVLFHSSWFYFSILGIFSASGWAFIIRRSHSWHLCKSCGSTVAHGKKYCDTCAIRRKSGKI